MLKLFRLITSIRTYVAILATLVLVLLISRTEVLSFRRLPSLTVVTHMKQGDKMYIAHQEIANQSVLLAYLNISIGHNIASNVSTVYGTDIQGTTSEQALMITKYLNSLRSTNPISLQKNNPDGSDLDTTVHQGRILLTKGQSLITPLTTIIQQQESIVIACQGDKEQADTLYNQGLQNYNTLQIQQATDKAQKANTCIADAGVTANSVRGVVTNLQKEITLTSNYIDLIVRNRDLLIRYGGEIATDVPEQLLNLQRELSKL